VVEVPEEQSVRDEAGGVEEMHADDLVGPAGGDRDLGDRQRAGVGREDRRGLAHRVQLAEDLLLEVEVLGYRLDHEVDVAQVTQADGEGDARQQRVPVRGGQLAALDRALGGAGQLGPAPFQRRVVHLDGTHGQAVAREHLDDPGAHRAQPDDTHAVDLARHRDLLPNGNSVLGASVPCRGGPTGAGPPRRDLMCR
jgi:hypothetical protein